MIIISIYVSMFTAVINLLVDFLFVDILFAPTLDSKKKEVESKEAHFKRGVPTTSVTPSSRSVNDTVNSVTEFRSVVSLGNGSDSHNFGLTRMQSGKFDLETTRVVPSSTHEAHSLAVLCVKDIIKDRDSEMKSSQSRRDLNRQSSSLFQQKRSLEKHRSELKVRGESSKVKQNMSLMLDKTAVEDQFVDLSVDIIEQRKVLKRSQQERFDEMWG